MVPDDKEALINGFKYFAEMNSEERAKMGENSRDYALTHLTREVNLSLVINSIKEIVQ